MSELINFVCKICTIEMPISEKHPKYEKKCIQCEKDREMEYREKNKDLISTRKRVYRIINKDKIKEAKKEYVIKKRNEKYAYTEEKIKEIDNQ